MPAMAETVFSQLPQLAGNQAVPDNLRRHGNRLSGTINIKLCRSSYNQIVLGQTIY